MISSEDFIEEELRSLLTRLDGVKPFALVMPSLPAAAVSKEVLKAMERHLTKIRRELRERITRELRQLDEIHDAQRLQARYSILKLRFGALLAQLNIFSEVLTQRAEHKNGVLISGLDAVARDALTLPLAGYRQPPMACYLEKGLGAAIRRAHTRLPGGESNPVSIIRIPRERMVSSALAGSLFHEVGHQGAALLDWVAYLQKQIGRKEPQLAGNWLYWSKWISEIAADFWSVAKLGATSASGMISVLTLPKAFVYRVNVQDPHPAPWLRVLLVCGFGQALYPDPIWSQLKSIWVQLYPLQKAPARDRQILHSLHQGIDEFVQWLLALPAPGSKGISFGQLFAPELRQPERLRDKLRHWQRDEQDIYTASPTLVFAVLGLARLDKKISPRQEARLIAKLLTYWALNRQHKLDIATPSEPLFATPAVGAPTVPYNISNQYQ